MKSIVVGTDGSETAGRALREAADLARATGACLHIVSAFEHAAGTRIEGGEDIPDRSRWMVGADAQVDAVLENAAGELHTEGMEVRQHARHGDPADALLAVAEEEDAELIVVGNKGMTGAKRFLLGSVPDKVSHHASCSVLIVRTT